MAITKTNLYHVETETSFLNLYNYLLENAVPTYFDSIVKQEDNSYMSCFVGDFELMRINQNPYTGGVILYSAFGESKTCKPTGTDYKYYRCAYKCGSGIMIAIISDTIPALTITKDNNGDTVIITSSSFSLSSSNITSYCINKYSNIKSRVIYKADGDAATALCPIVVPSTPLAYVQSGYLLVYSESDAVGIMELNGEQYLTNGLWCLKD